MRPAGLLLAGLTCLAATAQANPLQPITIVAHRGLTEGVPENTLAAFRQSIDRGVQIIELDLRITKDGQLVVIHDPTLDRTTNCAGSIAAMELEAVRLCATDGGEHVPTFAEVIALVRDRTVRILADVKDGTPIGPVLQAIRDQHAESKVILGIRSTKHVARARAELPGTTILAFMPEVGDAKAFAAAGANIIRLWSDWVEADPGLVAATRALGPEVWILVGRNLPRKKRDWRDLHTRMIATGAQGLITDRPELISAP